MKIELGNSYKWKELPLKTRKELAKDWGTLGFGFGEKDLATRTWSLVNCDPGRYWVRSIGGWSKPIDPKYNRWSCSMIYVPKFRLP